MEDLSMLNNAGKVIWTLSTRSLINLKSAMTHLPVASLDDHAVQNIMLEIQRACKEDDEALEVPMMWMCVLQLSQIASDRLLQDMQLCEENLSFWESQLLTGAHTNPVRLGLGPGQFVADLGTLLRLLPDTHVARTEEVQRRVLLLKVLRPLIATTLASIHRGADILATDGNLESMARSMGPGVSDLVMSHQQWFSEDVGSQPLSGKSYLTSKDLTMCAMACFKQTAVRLATWLAAMHIHGSFAQMTLRAEILIRDSSRAFQSGGEDALQAASGTSAAPEVAPQLGKFRTMQEEINLLAALLTTEDSFLPLLPLPISSHPRTIPSMTSFGMTPTTEASTKQEILAESAAVIAFAAGAAVLKRDRSEACTTEAESERQDARWATSLPGASAALAQARRVGRVAGPTITLPRWVLMPSQLQRHWLSVACGTGVVACSAHFVYRHSSWGGSNDFERWSRSAIQSLRASWQQHILDPLVVVKEELFNTFRQRPGHASMAEYEASRRSLLRMLDDFKADSTHSQSVSRSQGTSASVVPPASIPAASTPTSGNSGSSSSSNPSSSNTSSNNSIHHSNDSGRMSKPLDLSNAPTSFAHSMLPSGPATQTSRSVSVLSVPQKPVLSQTPQPVPIVPQAPSLPQTPLPASFTVEQPRLQVDGDALVSGMAVMMSAYEEELKHPIRNLVGGQLLRALLIQVQRLKVDTEAAMLELDQILKANELSISLVAAVPALALTWAVLSTTVRWLIPRAPDVQREAAPLRMAMVELERCLLAEVAAPAEFKLRAEGLVLVEMNKVFCAAVKLYSQHDRTSSRSEWPPLYKDLLDLAQSKAPASQLQMHERIMRRYQVFKL